jgi:UDP-perosamine 4-acetyltransferase
VGRPVVVLGAGGHAKVVLDILSETADWDVLGCLSPPGHAGAILGYPVLGGDDLLAELHQAGVRHAFVAVGDNRLRRDLCRRVQELGFELINAISARASLSRWAELGKGVAIMAGAAVNAQAILGDGVIVNTGATVDHDVFVGPYAHIGPGSHLAGSVHVEEGAFLGIGSSVIPGVRIGAWSLVGAGAAVIEDIPPFATAVGVPARVIKYHDRDRWR